MEDYSTFPRRLKLMLVSPVDIADQRISLLEHYHAATPAGRQILQVLAVVYEPVGKISAMLLNNLIGAGDRARISFTDSSFGIAWKALLQTGLLIQDRGQGYWCHPLIVEIAMREVVKAGHLEKMIAIVDKQMPVTKMANGPILFRSPQQCLRWARWAVYRYDLDAAAGYLEMNRTYGYVRHQPLSLDDVLQLVGNNPFNEEWLDTCPNAMADRILIVGARQGTWQMRPIQPLLAHIEAIVQEEPKPDCGDGLLVVAAEQFLLRNQLAEAATVLTKVSPEHHTIVTAYEGWLAFLYGDIPGAIGLYELSLQVLRKQQKKRKLFFEGLEGVFFVLALLQDGSGKRLSEAEGYINSITKQSELSSLYRKLTLLLKIQQGDLTQKPLLQNSLAGPMSGFERLIGAMCVYWVDGSQFNKSAIQGLVELQNLATIGEYYWLAMETSELLSRIQPKSNYGEIAQTLRAQSGVGTIVETFTASEPWELCLTALTNLNKPEDPGGHNPHAEFRLAWFVQIHPAWCAIVPKEQKINAKGVWSKGRAIALKRLKQNVDEFSYLTAQDLRACQSIKTEYTYSHYGNEGSYRMETKALLALVGHPAVFWEDLPDVRIDLVKAEPELLVKKDLKQQRLLIKLSPPIITKDQTVAYEKETMTRLRVIEIQPSHHRIAEILGASNQLEVPFTAQERVLGALGAISGLVTIHSDIGGGMENVEEVPADSQPHIHLLPINSGLKATILVKPFAIGGSYFRAGKGGETVIAEIEGKRLQTTRALKEERQRVRAVIAECPTLADWPQDEGEWLIDEAESCLELLLELQALGDTVTIEWPEGERMRVKSQASSSDFSMNIKRQRDWFEASGELKIGGDDVLNMQELMTLLDNTQGRFIPLGNGEFLALTEAFRKQLDDLRGYSEKQGDGVRFHNLAALALDEMVDAVGQLKVDKHWKEHKQKLKAAQAYQPKLPSTLQAELRDYQQEGFEWLARLAHWGVGACLADDMGLGKTLQALALMLTRSPNGPTLVLAPLSVCMNWLGEVAKFAPTLNVVQFAGGDRQAVVDALKPFDLLICSYGLLQQDEVAEMLAGVEWETVVLDEAQAIKNMATKRSQAAMKLQAGFKLITTGTPIENHLGELWNLFRFINPGLLGSLEQFNQRFAGPIEQEQDAIARHRLKQLIQPFMLRRTKTQVLSELPSRTEILLQVELSKEEQAFYEALRQESIRKLTDSEAAPGTKHLQVLAEIMKLRRACCNPSLVQPKIKLQSSKLTLFGEVLTELLDNNHKALVFSQFVDHLAILQDYLKQQNINYQYLDGSTPAKERKRRVDAFQAGEGDVFLISLKAGGTGLNLTAADYVIHMDPWWNPAVEDQASDRAHRIGQHRPVTIYRLVAQGTIEEKIVDLHHQKRDLASSLLEGTDMSGKVSTAQLLKLIQEG